ncbi:MAG: CDP-alcohol phosphatidyltransferase family protein [Candidatus Micrarchaeota archaeon]
MLKQNKKLKTTQSSFGSFFARFPLSPNQWTLLSLIIALIAGFAIAFLHDLIAGLMLFVLAAGVDAIDGAVARAKKQVSKIGGFLDGVIDRFVEAIFLFSFMFYQLPTIYVDTKIWLSAVIFLGACMPSFIRAYADHKGVLSTEKALKLGGICERIERLMILIIGLVVGIFYNMDFFIYSLILVVALSLITIIQRIVSVVNQK